MSTSENKKWFREYKYGLLQPIEYDDEGNRVVSQMARQFLPEEIVEALNEHYKRKQNRGID
jgi:hypothetical protein